IGMLLEHPLARPSIHQSINPPIHYSTTPPLHYPTTRFLHDSRPPTPPLAPAGVPAGAGCFLLVVLARAPAAAHPIHPGPPAARPDRWHFPRSAKAPRRWFLARRHLPHSL